MSRVWIGTSGWTYDGWRGPFYPPKLAKKNWLRWYASQFPTTEINGSFYRTPSLEAVAAWRDQTPKDFLFAWKASKFITHWKRLREKCANSIELMETRLKVLSPKVGAVLFQLPPQFTKNRERLASFLEHAAALLPLRLRVSPPELVRDDIYDLMRAHDVSLCLSDHHDAPSPWEVTARHVYVRGHGPTAATRTLSGQDVARLGAPHRNGGASAARLSISTTIRRVPRRRTLAGCRDVAARATLAAALYRRATRCYRLLVAPARALPAP